MYITGGYITFHRQKFASASADKFLFLIWKSKGRQPLGESPSPSDCVGVSRLVLRPARAI
ncbi:MAG: hypothetical protein LBU34_00635 [Planctomycetaceae bacterium]|nr:hypothetical protein [Planctomycetaceae bacterium]